MSKELTITPFTSQITKLTNIADRIVNDTFVVTDNHQICIPSIEGDKVNLSWLCNELHVKEVHLNKETSEYEYTIEFYTVIEPLTVTVKKGLITRNNLSELAKYGFSHNEGLTPSIIKYIILDEENAEKITDSTFVGWKNNEFFGYSQENRNYIGSYKLAVSETYDMETLNNLLDFAYNLQFCIVVGASSCLIGYLGQKLNLTTPIVHFYGSTSQGKTTGIMAGISVWGKADINSGMMSTWNQTENHLMSKLSNNFSIPVGLDEASICKYDLTSMIYNISQGINRQRLTKSGNPVETKQWLTCLMSNGEMELSERTNKNSGLKARIFEFEEKITLSAEHSNKIKSFIQSNYGCIGSELVKFLENSDFEYVKKQFQNTKQEILDLLLFRQPKNPITERVADYYAVWMLTADILSSDLKVDIDKDEIFKILAKHHAELNKTFNMGETVYNIICSYIIQNRSKFYDISDVPGIGEILTSAEGKFLKSNEVVILSTTIEKILKNAGFTSVKMCLKELYKLGVLIKQRKDTYYSHFTIGDVSAKTIHLIVKNSRKDR